MLDLTCHVVAARILFNAHAASCSRTDLCHLLDLCLARVVLHLPLAALTCVILLTRLADMHRLVVRGTDQERTGNAAEDVALGT